MASKPFDRDEQEFLKAASQEPDDLEKLVEAAPPALAGAHERIRDLTRARLGLAESPAQKPRPRARPWLPLAAAGAAVLLATGIGFATSPTAQAATAQLLHHSIPGVGITETKSDTLALAAPVTVNGERSTLTVLALISDGDRTELRFRITGLPAMKFRPTTNDGQPPQPALILPNGATLAGQKQQIGFGLVANGRGATADAAAWRPRDDRHPGLSRPAQGHPQRQAKLSGMPGLADPYTATLALTDVASAALTTAAPGGWSDQKNSVVIGAPYVAVERDKIVLTLMARQGEQPVQFSLPRILAGVPAPTLTDNLGNTYPINSDAPSIDGSGLPQLTFTGPVRAGECKLRLSVDAIQLTEEGDARLQVPLRDLPMGKPSQRSTRK